MANWEASVILSIMYDVGSRIETGHPRICIKEKPDPKGEGRVILPRRGRDCRAKARVCAVRLKKYTGKWKEKTL